MTAFSTAPTAHRQRSSRSKKMPIAGTRRDRLTLPEFQFTE